MLLMEFGNMLHFGFLKLININFIYLYLQINFALTISKYILLRKLHKLSIQFYCKIIQVYFTLYKQVENRLSCNFVFSCRPTTRFDTYSHNIKFVKKDFS